MKTLIAFIAVVATTILILSFAPEARGEDAPSESLYRAGEVNVDLAGTYSVGQRGIDRIFDTNARHGKFGASAGVSYFFTENFGVGVDGLIPDLNNIESDVVEHGSVSGIARLPLGAFAPSAFAGIGRDFDEGEYDLHAGVGVEYRFSKSVGVFVDGRYNFGHDGDSGLARAGVRFAF